MTIWLCQLILSLFRGDIFGTCKIFSMEPP